MERCPGCYDITETVENGVKHHTNNQSNIPQKRKPSKKMFEKGKKNLVTSFHPFSGGLNSFPAKQSKY